MAQSIERDRRGFKELAKLAGSPARPKASSVSGIRPATKPEGTSEASPWHGQHKDEHDSGMVDLELLASTDPGASDRASATPLASATLFEDEPASAVRPSLPSNRLPAALPLTPAVPWASPLQMPPIASAETAKRAVGLRRVAGILGIAAIAAGVFFVAQAIRQPRPQQVAQVVGTTEANVAHVTGTPAAAVIATTAPPPLTPAVDHGIDPLSLPKGTTEAARPLAHVSRASRPAVATNAEPKNAPAAALAEEAAPSATKADLAAKTTSAPPAANDALLSSIKQAADTAAAAPPSPASDTPTPAAANIGSTPTNGLSQRPSQGQVTGALGGALPDARACLGENDGVSRARVVFGSDGVVQSVTVTGFAAGKPVEACIKTALGKAHVPPFAEASYGATVTVRP